jgi:uncharacterized protein (TIGR03086 family)
MPALDLGPATKRLSELVLGVDDAQLDGPTPCEEMSVAALLDHLSAFSVGFVLAARKDVEGLGRPPAASADHLPADWRTSLPQQLDALAEAWRDPEAWTGMTRAGSIDLPGEVCGIVALDELVLHSWDLAMATGQPFDVEPDHLEAVHGFVSSFEVPPDAPADANQLFGPAVQVPADAPLLDRTLGLAGRDPGWSPARSH